ncbi:MAG TPA: HNH endonuclease [Candidatus Saccharimonadales bacterium]|nr:HNH endonuclease [Candidatus Saccharimonadales bacterium]
MIDIPGYEGRYAITKHGKVWSYAKVWIGANGAVRNHTGKWLKPYLTGTKGKQYYCVDLGNNTFRVHILVAEAFLPNEKGLPFINHKDGDRFNNHWKNLEWCTQQENSDHAERTGLNKRFYGERHGKHKLTSQEVEEIRLKKAKGLTLKQLAQEYRSCISNISYICRKETRIYG